MGFRQPFTGLRPGSVTADQIADGAVTGPKIAAGAITADKIDVGALDGKTITGALIQTQGEPARGIKLDALSNTLRAFNPTGGQTFLVDADTGSVELTGTFRSRADGERVEIRADYWANKLSSYSGTTYENAPGELSTTVNSYGASTSLLAPGHTANTQAGNRPSLTVSEYAANKREVAVNNADLVAWGPVSARVGLTVESGGLALNGGALNLNEVSDGIDFGHGGRNLTRFNVSPPVSYTADANGYFTIAHGLGVVPLYFDVRQTSNLASANDYVWDRGASTSTHVKVRVLGSDNSIGAGAVRSLAWLALA